MRSRDSQPGNRFSARPKRSRPFRVPVRQSKDSTEESSSVEGGDRLQKVLAQAGIASRRECEELIREGRIEVDRHVVTELGTRVDPQRQEIRVDGEALARQKLVYFAVHKPVGVVCTSRDPAGRPRVIDMLPPNTPRAFCVGRLDLATEGLILVTNDGELANGLTHPRHGVEKVYHVQVAGEVKHEVLAKLHKGVHLAEGYAKVKHVRIKSRRKRSTILEMVLDEGRNREVRRLLARVGHKVQRLTRIAVGPVRLGELPAGAVRPLLKKEIVALEAAIAHGPRKVNESDQGVDGPRRKPQGRAKASHKDSRDQSQKRVILG